MAVGGMNLTIIGGSFRMLCTFEYYHSCGEPQVPLSADFGQMHCFDTSGRIFEK